ncbi:MAG: AAA family ATPase [Lachnospiraceae bacterium]|nr:AAA family ATPase [Lachnospiraceae bacterium]
MIIYKTTLKYRPGKAKTKDLETLSPKIDDKSMKAIISDANELLGQNCGLDGNLSAQIVDGKPGVLDFILFCEQEKVTIGECEEWMKDLFTRNYAISRVSVGNTVEISVQDMIKITRHADRIGYSCKGGYLYMDLGLDYLDNFTYTVHEYLYDPTPLTREEAFEKATLIMADQSFLEELERIYSDRNERKFYGHPVHYKIAAANVEAAREMLSLLVRALRSNGRLLSTRATYLCDIEEGAHHEEDLDHLFKLNSGATVAIDMSGSDQDHGVYASSYHQVIQYLAEQIRKTQLRTLTVFVEITERPGFSIPMISALQDTLHIIELKEGHGDRKKALEYLKALTKNAMFDTTKKELEKVLPKKDDYTISEVLEVYNKWFSNGLKHKFYQSYRDCEKVSVDFKHVTDYPYEELQKMIGLTEIKEVVDQIINGAKVQNARKRMGLDSYKTTQHMIFTGNPGSAKTTVARLLAQILKKEEVLESGKLVECGRADLIAKYVGWTAKTVREKFKEAQGGILFIDEAYSLVDDSNSFGNEAINTIVQEMENHRDDVIVIFAGYPDKMEQFLRKNEGLRSRIAFHLHFPDYSEEELWEILKLMAKEKGYTPLSNATQDKCLKIFSEACKNPEFGNGRFVRNLLEQAALRQSDRIIRESGGKHLSKAALTTLIADDFDVTVSKQYAKQVKQIGF